MKKLSLFICLLLSFSLAHAEKLKLRYKNNAMEAYNSAGKVIIPAKFRRIKHLVAELYLVVKDNNYGLYNSKGQELLPCRYSSIQTLNKFVVIHDKNKRCGLLNEKGKVIIKTVCESIQIRDEICRYRYKGLWGLYFRSNKKKIAPKYKFIDFFDNKRLAARQDKESTLIDEQGRTLYSSPHRIKSCGLEHFRLYSSTNKKYGLLDLNGRLLIPCKHDWLGQPAEGKIIYKENELYGFLSLKGEVLCEARFQKCEAFRNNMASVLCGTVGFQIDENFKFIGLLKSTLIPYKEGGLYGYKNQENKVIIRAQFAVARGFLNGVAVVGKKSEQGLRYGLISTKGQVLCPIKFHDIGPGGEGLHSAAKIVKGNKLYGYINKHGQWLIEARFKEAKPFILGHAMVKFGFKKIVINKEGKEFAR